MTLSKSVYFYPALLALFITGILCATGLMTRPLFPVDETRYLTVAWEMLERHNFILPTLNFEPYHHKPPVLFWLINLMWSIFGVSQQSAMIVPYLTGFTVLMLTSRLATRLFPDNNNAPLFSVALLGGSLPFVIYTNLIMFDLLLTVAVLIGITAIWDYFKTTQNKHILTLAAAIGLGALIKGPVILLHLAPVIFLCKIWTDKTTRPAAKSYAPKFLGALLIGVLIGLCWAIPAAIQGGEEFAHKIFYGQTTGRVVNAFDHKRPIFWYFTFLPLFFLPWAAAPAFWSGLKSAWNSTTQKPLIQFLMCWVIPVFVAFCFISGKQVHYLLPLMPPIALLATTAFLQVNDTLRKRDSLPILIVSMILTLVPVIAHLGAPYMMAHMPKSVHLVETFNKMWITPPFVLVACMLIATVFILKTKKKQHSLITTALAMALMMCGFQIAAQNSFFANYNLTAVGSKIIENPDRPVAFLGGYNGEFSFLGRITKPITLLPDKTAKTAATWLNDNPTGLVIVFTRTPEDFAAFKTLSSMPYRMTNTYLVLENVKFDKE